MKGKFKKGLSILLALVFVMSANGQMVSAGENTKETIPGAKTSGIHSEAPEAENADGQTEPDETAGQSEDEKKEPEGENAEKNSPDGESGQEESSEKKPADESTVVENTETKDPADESAANESAGNEGTVKESPEKEDIPDETPLVSEEGQAVFENQNKEVRGERLEDDGVPVFSLTYGTDGQGEVTGSMLKGDVNRDGKVTKADWNLFSDMLDAATEDITMEEGDLNNNGFWDATDNADLGHVVNGQPVLFDSKFTFRVTDTPSPGYIVSKITVNGTELTGISYDTYSVGYATVDGVTYEVTVRGDNTYMITGDSLPVNDIRFEHQKYEEKPVITLSYGTDENGKITDSMLRGDVTGDNMVTKGDWLHLYDRLCNEKEDITEEEGDLNNNGYWDGYDSMILRSLADGKILLPYQNINFRVEDTPDLGCIVDKITVNGAELPDIPYDTYGTWCVLVNDVFYWVTHKEDNTYTVTGNSVEFNDIQFTHRISDDTAVMTLTFGTDGQGEITDSMLKGDVNRDGRVTKADWNLFSDMLDAATEDITMEEGDLNNNGFWDATDNADLGHVVNGQPVQFDSQFTFRVTDTPKDGFEVSGITVNGRELSVPEKGSVEDTLIEETAYTVSLDENGVAAVTGQSLAENDVRFAHAPVPVPDDRRGKITAEDFSYDIKDGELKEDKAKELAKAALYDKDGAVLDMKTVVADPEELSAVNEAIKAGKTGEFALSFSAPDVDRVQIKVTLTGGILLKPEEPTKNPDDTAGSGNGSGTSRPSVTITPPDGKAPANGTWNGKTLTSAAAKTGDSYDLGLFVTLFTAAAGALAGILFLRYRQKNVNGCRKEK